MDEPHTFKVGQFVKVKVNARGKTEIGCITAVLGDEVAIETKSGFEVKTRVAMVSPALLLILDLNGVLVFRSGRKHCALRPHLQDFLAYIFKNFVVGVWSSSERRNGELIIEQAFGDFAPDLSFRMFRDECTPAPTEQNPHATVKNLAHLWVKFHGVFDQNNTIIIDDSAEKCSHLRNALCPLPYDATDANDGELVRLVEVLKSIQATGQFFEILDAEQASFAGSLKAREGTQPVAAAHESYVTSPTSSTSSLAAAAPAQARGDERAAPTKAEGCTKSFASVQCGRPSPAVRSPCSPPVAVGE